MRPLRLSGRARFLLEERFASVLAASGLASVIVGVLTYSLNTTLVSVTTFFVGLCLLGSSGLVKVGVAGWDLPMRNRLGTVLLFSGVCLFAAAFVSFTVIDISQILVPSMRGILAWAQGHLPQVLTPIHYNIHVKLVQPFVNLTPILFLCGVLCFVGGAILKVCPWRFVAS
jgi:hypothetical protein